MGTEDHQASEKIESDFVIELAYIYVKYMSKMLYY